MPRGSCTVRYPGKRGVVWRVKYADADGQQVQETLGPESDGWTERKAEAELRERLVRVQRRGYRKPKRLTFGDYARTWFEEGQRRRRWRPRTLLSYRRALERLGVNINGEGPDTEFGPLLLGNIRPRDVAAFTRQHLLSFSAATVNLDLTILHDVLKTAKREELIDSNAAEAVERPKVERRRWRILSPVEVGVVLRAFTDEQARVMFLDARLDRRPPVRAARPPLARR